MKPPSALLIQSPDDLEARYRTKRDTHWVGYKLHITETCDADRPDLITQVLTTPATTQDCVVGPTIQQDLAERDLLPRPIYWTVAMLILSSSSAPSATTTLMWSGRQLAHSVVNALPGKATTSTRL